MITCRELISFLLEYLEGTLPDAEKERFDLHLSLCASCVAYLHTYEVTIRLEQELAIEESDVPEELVRAVVASRGV